MLCRLGLSIIVTLAWVSISHAQSLNIDLNSDFGPPPVGAGPPSSAFGAAANTPGFWNSVTVGGFPHFPLVGLDGLATNAFLEGILAGGGGGTNIAINTGDYALLLNDAKGIDRILGLDFSIEGLQNGRYEVYTYTASISNWTEVQRTRVAVSQSIGSLSQIQTGPMPGNQLINGLTHTTHVAQVLSGRLDFRIDYLETSGQPWLSGLQIKQVVPEPSSFIAIVGLLVPMFLKPRERNKCFEAS